MFARLQPKESIGPNRSISNCSAMLPSPEIDLKDILIDIVLIVLLTSLAFGLAYHPYFFGDELVAQRLAIHNNYAFAASYWDTNSYKPRLVFNAIDVLLAKCQAPRFVYATLVAGCMVWINVLLYCMTRYLIRTDRAIAWLLIAIILTSRYGTMLYFDYLSGLIELLSTALLLSVLFLVWLAWHHKFSWWYAAAALVLAILNVFVHERYVVALIAIGCAIAIAESAGSTSNLRFSVVAWALSLGVIPLVLFGFANRTLGSLPLSTGTAGQVVILSVDMIWGIVTYVYNVFLGGNYGHEWFWGHYNHLHSVGKILGWVTATCTVLLTVIVVFRKGIVRNNLGLGLSLAAVVVALIMVASLTGLGRQEARFMVPAGILVPIVWIVMLKGRWRHMAIGLILATNVIYLLLGSHDSIANIYSSRAAASLASSVLGVMPSGKRGIVVGNDDDSWSIGGGGAVDMEPKLRDTFSVVNLRSGMYIEPFVRGRDFDPGRYDFGLAFNGFGPHRTARYRLVSVGTALILAGVSDVDKLPVHAILGNNKTWGQWQWKVKPDQDGGAIKLFPGTEGWYAVPSVDLDRRWLVLHARTIEGIRVPMRLQVNWHARRNNRFLSTTIEVVYPSETWHSYATLLNAPPDADIGYIYATLYDGAHGVVEVNLVELK